MSIRSPKILLRSISVAMTTLHSRLPVSLLHFTGEKLRLNEAKGLTEGHSLSLPCTDLGLCTFPSVLLLLGTQSGLL